MDYIDISKIETAYKNFTNGIAMCEMNHRLSIKIIQNQKQQIKSDYKKLFDENEVDIKISTDCMLFYRWENNSIETYGRVNTTLNSYWNKIVNYHNKLYQWQLVTAFEFYEKYLKEIITTLSSETKQKKNLNTKIKELLPGYIAILENKSQPKIDIEKSQENPSRGLICKQTKNKIINIIDPINYDHEFSISLIEQFRHIVTHENGKIKEKGSFIKKTLEKIGKYNNGNYDQVYGLVLDAYLNNDNEIQLLEIPNLIDEYIIAETDVLGNLFSILLNSAYYIFQETKK